MKSAFRLLPVALVATFAVAGAQAQSTTSYPSQSGERASMLPYTHNGYTGISAGSLEMIFPPALWHGV